MDHVVYTDTRAKEMEKMLDGEKTMIQRGAAGRKLPYGKVNPGDTLYLINNNAEGLVKARAAVTSVFNSERMSKEESRALIIENQGKLQLSEKQYKRWAGKRYLVLIEVVEQLVDASQTRAIGAALHYASKRMDGEGTLRQILEAVLSEVAQRGLDILSPTPRGDYAEFRIIELGAAANRLRTLSARRRA